MQHPPGESLAPTVALELVEVPSIIPGHVIPMMLMAISREPKDV